MSESKHTPGPWCIVRYAAIDADGKDAQTSITAYADENGEEGAGVATVNRWSYGDDPPTAESEANARLIAAAPDLLEALKSAEAVLETASRYFPKSIRNGDRFSLHNVLKNAVKPAIAKAEGSK